MRNVSEGPKEDAVTTQAKAWVDRFGADSLPMLQRLLATIHDPLVAAELGCGFAALGHSAECRLIAEHLRDELAIGQQSAQGGVAESLLSMASALLNRGLWQDAVGVLDATRAAAEYRGQVAVAGAALLEKSYALKKLASASHSESLITQAIATCCELENMLRGRFGEPFDELIARGMYNRAGALSLIHRFDEARICFAEVAARCQGSLSPELQQIGALASIRGRMLVSVPDPPPYILRPIPFQSESEAASQYASEALGSHREATEVLNRHRVKADPFVLFLRSFELESMCLTTSESFTRETGLGPQVVSYSHAHPSTIECAIMDALSGQVITIGSQYSYLESAWSVPRLFLPGEGWQEVVESLVRSAHGILVYAQDLSPGLSWELECIQRLGRTSSTMVVLADLKDTEDTKVKNALRRFSGPPEPPARRALSKTVRELAGFEIVFEEHEFGEAGLAATPSFSDWCKEMKEIRHLDPESRVQRYASLLDAGPAFSPVGNSMPKSALIP